MWSARQPAADALPVAQGRQEAIFVDADVRDADQAAGGGRPAVERFGRLDVLVNNAGGSPSVPAADASARFVAQVIALNLLAPFYCAQAANPVMQDQSEGRFDRQHRQRVRAAAVAGHRRLRRRQGRTRST